MTHTFIVVLADVADTVVDLHLDLVGSDRLAEGLDTVVAELVAVADNRLVHCCFHLVKITLLLHPNLQ